MRAAKRHAVNGLLTMRQLDWQKCDSRASLGQTFSGRRSWVHKSGESRDRSVEKRPRGLELCRANLGREDSGIGRSSGSQSSCVSEKNAK